MRRKKTSLRTLQLFRYATIGVGALFWFFTVLGAKSFAENIDVLREKDRYRPEVFIVTSVHYEAAIFEDHSVGKPPTYARDEVCFVEGEIGENVEIFTPEALLNSDIGCSDGSLQRKYQKGTSVHVLLNIGAPREYTKKRTLRVVDGGYCFDCLESTNRAYLLAGLLPSTAFLIALFLVNRKIARVAG